MSELTISRLSATVHQAPGFDHDARRIDGMLRRAAERRLDAALARAGLPDGEWCVRRLDVEVQVAPDGSDATIEDEWAATVLQSLHGTLDSSSTDVVHYQRGDQALDDLFASIATGDASRAWAWLQVGVLAASDPAPESDPAGAMIAAGRRRREHVLRAILGAVQRTSIAALHRVLGADGWMQLATEVASAARVGATDIRRLLNIVPDGQGQAFCSTDAVVVRSEHVLENSTFAAAIVRSGLRPSGSIAAWAVLAVAETDPAALRLSTADDLVRAVGRALRLSSGQLGPGLVGARPTHFPNDGEDGDGSSRSPAVASDAPPVANQRRKQPVGVATPDAAGGQAVRRADESAVDDVGIEQLDDEQCDAGLGAATIWGGLLFLLATAEEAGVPDDVASDVRLSARSVRWMIHQMAQLLVPVAENDPAVLALAGLVSFSQLPTGPSITHAERSALLEGADRWAAATALRLGDTQSDPAALVAGIATRRAQIFAERGWIEVQFDLAEVDVAVRMAALDVDPGWVPWLGVVVRFVYV